jgi:hypothetical protein
MARQIIFHGDYFTDFYKDLDIRVKMKIKKEYFESKKIKT